MCRVLTVMAMLQIADWPLWEVTSTTVWEELIRVTILSVGGEGRVNNHILST